MLEVCTITFNTQKDLILSQHIYRQTVLELVSHVNTLKSTCLLVNPHYWIFNLQANMR